MIIILQNTTAAVQPCLPPMIYAVKSRIQATTTVVQFMRCSFKTHFKGAGWSTVIECSLLLRTGTAYRESRQDRGTLYRAWLKHGNRVQIALACRHSASGHRVSCICAARVAAYLWWQLNIMCAAILDWSLLLLVAGGNLPPQLLQAQCSVGSPHNAVHCLVILYLTLYLNINLCNKMFANLLPSRNTSKLLQHMIYPKLYRLQNDNTHWC